MPAAATQFASSSSSPKTTSEKRKQSRLQVLSPIPTNVARATATHHLTNNKQAQSSKPGLLFQFRLPKQQAEQGAAGSNVPIRRARRRDREESEPATMMPVKVQAGVKRKKGSGSAAPAPTVAVAGKAGELGSAFSLPPRRASAVAGPSRLAAPARPERRESSGEVEEAEQRPRRRSAAQSRKASTSTSRTGEDSPTGRGVLRRELSGLDINSYESPAEEEEVGKVPLAATARERKASQSSTRGVRARGRRIVSDDEEDDAQDEGDDASDAEAEEDDDRGECMLLGLVSAFLSSS